MSGPNGGYSSGPVGDAAQEPVKEAEAPQQHIKTKKGVKCAICGKEFKTLTERHLKSHGLLRKEYMEKFGVSKADMAIKGTRKTATGEANPLKQMQMIMKEFNVPRGGVTEFIKGKGYDGLKALSAAAKEKNVGILELLK